MPTSLGISEARDWRIGGGDERLNMRTVMDCAWMLDGAIKDRILMCMFEFDENNEYACMFDCGCGHGSILFQELRVYMRWEPYGWIGPEGRYDERNDVEMIE
ncbi:hypothetical protein PIB30_029198 [Stylosanthes scabra]|uniref:Uncharacterized protein n=1 Tax=Stylosanthes scabra TaxID=79078 RepID=A0ABU6QBT8_9FABA|nr:hypothetical protein [Stylosanthes scabra]